MPILPSVSVVARDSAQQYHTDLALNRRKLSAITGRLNAGCFGAALAGSETASTLLSWASSGGMTCFRTLFQTISTKQQELKGGILSKHSVLDRIHDPGSGVLVLRARSGEFRIMGEDCR